MRILLLLFAAGPAWICFSDVAAYSNEEDIISFEDSIPRDAILKTSFGGETEQDPNDPKYQKMARDLVVNHLRIKEENIRSIQVTKVMTQVVSGIITRIHLRVILIKGKPSTCQFKVWEQPGDNVKHVTYECDDLPKKRLSGINTPPRPVQLRNPKDPKYKKLAKTSIESLFKHPGTKPFKKEDVKTISVAVVEVQIGSTIKSYLQFSVLTVNNKHFQCTSTVLEQPWNPEEKPKVSNIVCTLTTGNKKLLSSALAARPRLGSETYKNPDDPKYGQLAKESFEKYIQAHQDVHGKVTEFKVTQATEQVVSGLIIRLNFYVIPTNFVSFQCHSEIYEKNGKSIKISCENPPNYPAKFGGEFPQNPDDYKYAMMAKRSFEQYEKTHIGILVKEFKVTRVTKQVVNGDVYRIIFIAILRNYHSLPCHSKIYQTFHGKEDITINCGEAVGVDEASLLGGEEYQNPDKSEYESLAKECFREYERTHKVDKVVKDLKVTKVTTQVVSGIITRIDFYAIPTDFTSFQCTSEIYEKNGKSIKISCENPPNYPAKFGGEFPQNPDDYKYAMMAKRSFEQYEAKHIGILVKKFKVTRVTKQVIDGEVYRMIFFAITREYHSIKCHSTIYQTFNSKEDITVNCGVQNKLGAVGVDVGQNTDNGNLWNSGGKHVLTLKQSPKSKTGNEIDTLLRNTIREYLRNTERDTTQIDRTDTKSIRIFTTRLAKEQITYYAAHVSTHNMDGKFSNFDCSVLTSPWFGNKPFATNCLKETFLMGRSSWKEPTTPKYLSFAEMALQIYLNNSKVHLNMGPRVSSKYDIIVTFATEGSGTAGPVDDIHYMAHWVHGNNDDPTVLICHTKVWERVNGANQIIESKCKIVSWNRNRT